MRRQVIAVTLTSLLIPFTIYGAGHFYLKKYKEGLLFLIIGHVNMFSTFLYLPFEFDSLMGPNFISIISEFSSTELMAPIITMVIWGGLISASVIRAAQLSNVQTINVKQ